MYGYGYGYTRWDPSRLRGFETSPPPRTEDKEQRIENKEIFIVWQKCWDLEACRFFFVEMCMYELRVLVVACVCILLIYR